MSIYGSKFHLQLKIMQSKAAENSTLSSGTAKAHNYRLDLTTVPTGLHFEIKKHLFRYIVESTSGLHRKEEPRALKLCNLFYRAIVD